MQTADSKPELSRLPALRSWIGIAICTLFCLAAVASLANAQPPPDSLATKYPPKKPDDQKPAPKTENDPTASCPWVGDIIDDEPVMSLSENQEEYKAYNYFVLQARKFSNSVLAEHADKNLTWRVLFDRDRAKYRGKIVHVEGRLKRLVWIGSNKELESQGIKGLYEAWIFGENLFSNPTCFILTELPEGLKPGDDISNVTVHADGYFFKRYKYKAVNDTRLAPLIIGRTLSVVTVPTTTDVGAEAFGRLFVPTVLALALAMVAFAYVLHRWFHVSDRKVQQALQSARFGHDFIAPGTEPATHHYSDDSNEYTESPSDND